MTEKVSWTVVKFLNDNSVEAVPTKWIDGNECLWPNYTNEKLRSAIRRNETPISCWERFKIFKFRNATFDDYVLARKKSLKAEVMSDLNSSDCERRVVKPPRQLMYTSSSSSLDSSGDEQNLEKIPQPPPLPPVLNKKDNSNNGLSQKQFQSSVAVEKSNNCLDSISQKKLKSSLEIEKSADLTDAGSRCICCPVHKNKNDMIVQMIRKLAIMETVLADIRAEMEKQNNRQQLLDTTETIFISFDLPLKTEKELLELEACIGIEENMRKAVMELSKLGGSSAYDFVRRILMKLMSNHLASEYSWLGQKKKKIFSNLHLAKLITSAVEKNCKVSVKDIEDAIKKYLRRAKERADAESQRLSRNTQAQ